MVPLRIKLTLSNLLQDYSINLGLFKISIENVITVLPGAVLLHLMMTLSHVEFSVGLLIFDMDILLNIFLGLFMVLLLPLCCLYIVPTECSIGLLNKLRKR